MLSRKSPVHVNSAYHRVMLKKSVSTDSGQQYECLQHSNFGLYRTGTGISIVGNSIIIRRQRERTAHFYVSLPNDDNIFERENLSLENYIHSPITGILYAFTGNPYT